jgi:hypothetical protein
MEEEKKDEAKVFTTSLSAIQSQYKVLFEIDIFTEQRNKI